MVPQTDSGDEAEEKEAEQGEGSTASWKAPDTRNCAEVCWEPPRAVKIFKQHRFLPGGNVQGST